MKLFSKLTFTAIVLLFMVFSAKAKDDDNPPITQDVKFTPADIIHLADSLLDLSDSSELIFKTNVDFLIKTYFDKDDSYFDPVFIHLVNQYIKTDKVDWLDPKEKERLINHSNQLEPIETDITTDDDWNITILIKKLHKHYKIKRENEIYYQNN